MLPFGIKVAFKALGFAASSHGLTFSDDRLYEKTSEPGEHEVSAFNL